jgi:hypothetical protein
MSRYILEFLGRNESGSHGVNFLWNDQNTYIMDNHLCALWCWMQHYSGENGVDLIHVDAHYDTFPICEAEARACPDDIRSLDFNCEYLQIISPLKNICATGLEDDEDLSKYLFHWSNYLSFFLHRYHCSLGSVTFCTEKNGVRPSHQWNVNEFDFEHLMERLENTSSESIVMNIDLDYFVEISEDYQSGENCYHFTRSCQLERLFQRVLQLNNEGRILVLTICLSPECCCGDNLSEGWRLSEEILSVALRILHLNFQLPPN